MSTIIQRDKQPKGAGKAPAFQIRINPELKEQMSEQAAKEGMSLGNWIKELVRAELKRQGITPKG
ncbi:toxin-antitoxin system HicB family antitoxin [Enterobacter sp. FR 78]|uniref:YlcI/YnfO family protein n=1 Tax=Enterobacter TaxID=547 RepID=UPI0023A9856D|nr:YlcI/YnfO family protein [Enterobacter sp. FR 78]EKU2874169.1 toxin-antitoxin system HicB family antitoxin [Enterobacter cloacae]MDD9577867.1 toxin-antitoxin system HicB family antitoxin [Enterobacter sp. FR 78]